jgi:redox-sensitive bicupin YhaK (pirin superfamily)
MTAKTNFRIENNFIAEDGADISRVRPVVLSVEGLLTSDGDGVRLTRTIGSSTLPMLDPFLLLDMLYSDEPRNYLAGFPEHPHRGFETVTYVLAGHVRHEDSKGHAGLLEPGGVQWMTAGQGIVHSEMPEQENGLLWGFQLWINLPATQKMTEPYYQELLASEIPLEHRPDGSQVRVIAGQTNLGTTGSIHGVSTEPIYFDVTVAPGSYFVETIPIAHNSFIFVYEGNIAVRGNSPDEEQTVKAGILAVLGEGDQVQVKTRETPGKFLLIAGKPLNEPVARSGPFVMNTRAEVLQAYRDYWAGRL